MQLFKNQENPVCVVYWQFSSHPDRFSDCYHNLAFLSHIYHLPLDLLNEVLHDPVPSDIKNLKIQLI